MTAKDGESRRTEWHVEASEATIREPIEPITEVRLLAQTIRRDRQGVRTLEARRSKRKLDLVRQARGSVRAHSVVDDATDVQPRMFRGNRARRRLGRTELDRAALF